MESRKHFHVCLIRKNLHVVIAQFISQILSFSIYQGIKIERNWEYHVFIQCQLYARHGAF